MSDEPLARIGQIAGAFGLKGQVKIQPLTDFSDTRFVKGGRVRLDGEWVEIETASIHKGRPLLKLKGVDTIDAAEALQWKYLEAPHRPEMDEDEFLVEDLIGLRVRTVEGEELGEIDDVMQNPAHETLVIGEIMIPFVDEFVTEVDFDEQVVTVRLIPGMRPGEL